MPTKMAEKNAGSTTCGNEELVFLANAIKEGRKRRLKMQLALNNLAARRRRVLNLACLLLLLISQRKFRRFQTPNMAYKSTPYT